jgi:methionyl-tRNA synthetase
MKVLDIFKQDYEKIFKYIDDQDINSYMNFIVEQLFAANKYFNDEEPWKKKSDILRLNTIVYVAMELIRKITIMLYPIIPTSSLKVLNIFDIKENDIKFDSIQNHETLQKGTKINKINILFNKIEKND